jgi:hypothetical protein
VTHARSFLVLLALAQLTCAQSIMTAPSGSSMSMIANPNIISANGGVSLISVLVIEPSGSPVPDGTVVQFFTTLGVIDEQGKTNDGVVRVNLRANGRSGVATVSAVSGGDGGGLPGPSTTTTSTLPSGRAPTGAQASVPMGAAADPIEVFIGNVNAASVILTANPPRITNSNTTHVTATVFDTFGNPLPGVPVFFEVTGSSSTFIDDTQPKFTDSNGQATVVVRTRSAVSTTATITARVPTGEGFAEGTFTLEIVRSGA